MRQIFIRIIIILAYPSFAELLEPLEIDLLFTLASGDAVAGLSFIHVIISPSNDGIYKIKDILL